MSVVHSHRQAALNILTRSFDMSIRSIMNEELSSLPSKPLNDSASSDSKLRPPVEQDATQNRLDGSKLLSPKYLSSPGQNKEPGKLPTRPGQQKKFSPSKESGPPQPVKAIHSLPPSLTPSRENTFESSSKISPSSGPEGRDHGSRTLELSRPITPDSLADVCINQPSDEGGLSNLRVIAR